MNNGFPSPAAAMNGREPFASTPAGSTLVTGRPAEPSAAAIPCGTEAPVGHAEQDEHAGPGRYPGGERQDHFHRRGGAGDQPHHGGKPQRDPGSAPPRAAEPRRGGDRDRHGGGQKRGAHQRRAGKPRPLAGTGRQIAGPLSAREMDDPGHHGARQYGGTGQAGQQPEPAVTQRCDYCGGGRGDKDRLHQPGQHPARQGGRRQSSHGGSAGSGIGGMGGDGNRQRPGQYQPGDDQADHIARMPVAGGRQKPGPVFRGLRKRPDLGSG